MDSGMRLDDTDAIFNEITTLSVFQQRTDDSTQSESIVVDLMSVIVIAVPLTAYFLALFFVDFWGGNRSVGQLEDDHRIHSRLTYRRLAIAVAIAILGIGSKRAFMTVKGPLIGEPVLLGLVYASRYGQDRRD